MGRIFDLKTEKKGNITIDQKRLESQYELLSIMTLYNILNWKIIKFFLSKNALRWIFTNF